MKMAPRYQLGLHQSVPTAEPGSAAPEEQRWDDRLSCGDTWNICMHSMYLLLLGIGQGVPNQLFGDGDPPTHPTVIHTLGESRKKLLGEKYLHCGH